MPHQTKSRNHTSGNKDGGKKQIRYQESDRNISKHFLKDDRSRQFLYQESSSIFPNFTAFLVFVVTLTFRVFYVIDPKNWWMIHPDEVYQSVEVAHIEVYGYGFRPPDFSPPESPTADLTKYRQMQLKANMYALRSPLFPNYYVLVSWLAAMIGLQVNPYLLWRVTHVVITSLLPLTLYRFVSRLYGVKDKGHAAAILVATSTHLNVFGTHCLLHSFLSPFTFLALSILTASSSHDSKPLMKTEDHESLSNKATIKSTFLNGKGKEDILNNNESYIKSPNTKSNFKGTNKISVLNSNHINGIHNSHKENCSEVKDAKDIEDFSQKNSRPCPTKITSHIESAVGWFLATLICYIRPDVLVLFTVYVILFPQLRQSLFTYKLLAALLGVAAALVVGIGADFIYYGWGVFSPINWINFNVIFGFSTIIFGHMDWAFYIEKFFCHDIGILTFSIFAILALCRLVWGNLKKSKAAEGNTKDTELASKNLLSLKSLLVWFVLFLTYSFKGHKETRFIHDVIIIFFIFSADILVNLKHIFQSKKVYNNFALSVLVLFAANQWRSFPSRYNNSDWVYQRTNSAHDVNLCIKYISEQKDVTGVFYDANLYMTGGTSLLHHDVPIMSFLETGFYEFGPESRRNYTETIQSFLLLWRSSATTRKSVNEFTRASNYIALANARATVRIIAQKPVYNYLVLRQDRRFLDFGFVEVFSTRSNRVLRRLLDAESEYMLQGLLDKISMGDNATVLLHEGDVLFNMNQFVEASVRFYRALSLDEKLLEAYLPLQICYSKMGNDRAARAVRGKCLTLFGEASCSTPRKITRL